MVAGVSYTTIATERAAKAEAGFAKAQLSALRSQVNPHFLFNALHTVVQLIPKQPKQAADAAEKLAALLRTSIEEDRDIVPVREEVHFITRYLDLERVRFGDRLKVTMNFPERTLDATLPSFALQTLVENAVRHGAAPRIEPTAIFIDTALSNGTLTSIVRDTGGGSIPQETTGTGLKRLQERLAVLYQGKASLHVNSSGDGVVATLIVPQSSDE
jgi:two-component system, LytTR family, sensor kinase